MALVGSPSGAEVKEEDYPLFSKSNEDRVFRMSDAMALQKVAQSS